MKLTTDVKKQHTVPRFLLDNFGFGGSGKRRKLYTFDKQNGRIFQQSVYDATTRNTFYNIEGHPDRASLEPILGIYESEASPALKKILETKDLSTLSSEERHNIATFVAIQRARSYGELMRISAIVDALSDKLDSMGASPEQIETELGLPDSSERKNSFLSLILNQKEVVELLLNKSWILYESTNEMPFYISDNPVTLHNSIDMGPFGNLGIGLKGIQIHLPLSPTLTLALTCPSIAEQAIKAKNQVQELMVKAPHMLSHLKRPFSLIEYGNAYEKGTPIKQTSDNVRFLNSLQVQFSEQYVFSGQNDFSLAQEMIGDNEKYKMGMRMQVN
ncbi:DUF4238 domain-containing protein [Vibrio rotiferianus]|uniref:DUF4238 domain-containing protein n=1 Tax=Vibrio rotiferianus TaxID=190895 RepID=UPI00148C600C